MSIQDLNDSELMYWLQVAIEMQDGKYIKALKSEMSRRVREA